jgi:hypothetical protein
MIPLNLMIDRETYELLKRLAPTRTGKSAFITRLLYHWAGEHVERLKWEEKLRLQESAYEP